MFSNVNGDCAHALRRILQIIKLHNIKSRLMERCEIESYLQEIELGHFKTSVEQFLAGKCKKQLRMILKSYEEFEVSLSNRFLSGDFTLENKQLESINKSQSSLGKKRVGSSTENEVPLKKCCLKEQVINLPLPSSQLSMFSPDLFDKSSVGLKSQATGSNEFTVNVSNNTHESITIHRGPANKQAFQNNKSDVHKLMIISDSLDQNIHDINNSTKTNSYIQGNFPKQNGTISPTFDKQTENENFLVPHANYKNLGDNENSIELCEQFANYSIEDMPIIFADASTEGNYIVPSDIECEPVLQLQDNDKGNVPSTNSNVKGLDNGNSSNESEPIRIPLTHSNCNMVNGDATREEICSTIKESVVHIRTLYDHIKDGFVNATKKLEEYKPLPKKFIEELLESERLDTDKKLHFITMLFESRPSDSD